MMRVEILFLIALLCVQSESTRFEEPLDIQDVYDIFNDDGCIEGSLSVTETGSPLINSISFTEEISVAINESPMSNLYGGKSPLSLINELATFNNIQYVYNLTEEQGPSHKKRFGIYLELGNEKYFGEGSSINKARIEAAKLALNSTSYEHPPQKPKADKPSKYTRNPVDKLDSWANKHNAFIKYIYNEATLDNKHSNNYHDNMYTKSINTFGVIVQIGNHEFSGDGITLDEAKQNAARNALSGLQSAEGFCMFDNSEKSIIDKLFNSDYENDSPVSLVHQFSSKTKIPASFNLISEEGPAHIKNFVYKCNIGDKYESVGEGSSKKSAKNDAAVKMINYLKSLLPFSSKECNAIIKKNKKNKKRGNLIKNVNKISDDEDNSKIYIPDNIDPISKLMQIQQARHDVVPTFTLKEEDGLTNKEFLIEVTIGELCYIGSGPNKKVAKRKAAEGMLELMGYSTVNGKTRLVTSAKKKKEFRGSNRLLKRKPLFSGLNIQSIDFNSEEWSLQDDQPLTKQSELVEPNDTKDNLPSNNANDKVEKTNTESKTYINTRKEFVNFAQMLDIKFQFSDFPKTKDSGFVTLLSMTTRPPRVCFGTGLTSEMSQDHAAHNALENLYKNGLDSISRILRDHPSDSLKNPKLNIDEKNIINEIIIQETE